VVRRQRSTFFFPPLATKTKQSFLLFVVADFPFFLFVEISIS